jgi:hypothetical protein
LGGTGHHEDNIEVLAQEIISRSETATRNAIRKL